MKRISLVLCSLVLLPCSLFADQVQLRNGDRVTGTVLKVKNDVLQMRSDLMGEVKIPMSAVQSMVADQPVHLQAGERQMSILTLDATESYFRVETAERTMLNLPRAGVQAILSDPEYVAEERIENAGLLDLWSGSADAGFSATRGNAGSANLNLGLNAARSTPTDKLGLYFTSVFAQNTTAGKTTTSANAIRSGANYSVNVSDRLFTFGFTNFETNELQQLDLRNVVGGGLGMRLFKTPQGALELFSGGSLNQEFYTLKDGRRSGEALIGEEWNYNLSSRTLLSERLNFFPNLTVPGEYRATVDSSATLKLNQWMGWQVSLSNVYVSNPPLGAQNNDILLTTGIRFSLGQERTTFQPHSRIVEVLK